MAQSLHILVYKEPNHSSMGYDFKVSIFFHYWLIIGLLRPKELNCPAISRHIQVAVIQHFLQANHGRNTLKRVPWHIDSLNKQSFKKTRPTQYFFLRIAVSRCVIRHPSIIT